jgi:hypothetical protein
MKSVRLDADLQAQLRRAARATGVSESEFIRQAVADRSQEVLGDGLEELLGGLVGVVHSRGGRARQTSRRYVEVLRRKKLGGAKRRS